MLPHFRRVAPVLLPLVLLAAACGQDHADGVPEGRSAPLPAGRIVAARDSLIPGLLSATGSAEPVRQATLSTRLMGSITSVLVHEGDAVRQGQVLARVDSRDIAAQRARVAAAVAEAEAVRSDAETQARRFRGLYADSAATTAQRDAAETGLARAEAGLTAAQASAREVEATGAYATLMAPFAGVVSHRFVDPGSFVAPGSPVVTVEDQTRLRIAVAVAPVAASALHRGSRLDGTIEGVPITAVVEGVVPAGAGALSTVNALVDNPHGTHPAGGAATLLIPTGMRHALLVPQAAVVREGDLTGVRVVGPAGQQLRWVRLGDTMGELVEVLSGLAANERVLLPPASGRGA